MNVSDRTLAELALSYLQSRYRLGDQPLPHEYVVALYGRYSVTLVQRLASVIEQVTPQLLVVSGNKGKDTGPLVAHGIPEAHYLLSATDGLTEGLVFSCIKLAIDLTATNGAENAARMVELLLGRGFGVEKPCNVAVVAHQVQMLRLGLTFNAEAGRQGLRTNQILWVPSLFEPDLDNLVDQWEVLNEYVLLEEKSAEGLFPRPEGLRADLLTEARRARDRIATQVAPHELTTSWTS